MLTPFPDSTLDRPADGDWSPKDVVLHLLLSQERGSFTRIRAIVSTQEPTLPAIDENEELTQSALRGADVGPLLALFAEKRAADMDWMRRLDEPALARVGHHSEVGPVTAEQMLYHAAYHDCLHLRQLLGMLQAQFDSMRGPMRVF